MRARVLLCCAVLLAVLSLAGTSWAAPVMLSDFETDADFLAWEAQGHLTLCPGCIEHTDTITRVAAHATEGTYSCQIDMYGDQDYNGMLRETWPTTDWSAYNLLAFDVENTTSSALTVTVELDDTIHGPGWVNRHDENFVLTPGINHLRIWLNSSMTFNSNPGYLDLAHIGRFLFTVSGFSTDTTVYFDNLRLDNAANDPYADAARNIWKFDCGSWDSPVWPDFFQLAFNMNYPQDPATRPFGWVIGSGWHNKQANDWYGPDDLTRDFVRRCCPSSTPMDFQLDLPNGDYRVYMIARGCDWNGFPTGGWSITSEGVEVLNVPMDSTTFYAAWYYRGIHEDYPLSASAWDVFEVPQFPAYTFNTTVADGSLNLHFEGPVGVFAMIVYPASLESEMTARVAGYDAARRAQFEANYYINQPAGLTFTATQDEIARGYAAWPGQLMAPCYPDTLPPDPRPALTLSTFAAQGEYRSVGLAIRPLVTISGVAVTVTDLSDGAGHTIPNTEIEARYLRYMVTGDAEFFGSGLLSWKPRLVQKDFPISVAPQVSKDFWLTVHVPEGTPAGTYVGTVTLHASSGDLSVPLTVQVYGYPLDAGSEQAWGWYYMAPESEYVFSSFPDMAAQGDVFMHLEFADLKKHGFNSIQFPTPGVVVNAGHVTALNTTQLERYVTTAREEGFGGDWLGQTVALGMADAIRNATGFAEFSPEFDVAYKEAIALLVAWMDTPQGAPLAIWLVDEPRESGLNSWNRNFADTMQYATLAHEVPGAITTVTVMSGADGAVDYGPFVGALDIMQTHPWPNSENLMQGAYAAGKSDWFFNTGGDLRMVYGFYQYKYGRGNGAWEWHLNWMDSGMFDPWPYSPYNDHWRYFYPSPDGPVPTLSYELAGQGTWDYRYIATLDRLITEANASLDPEMVDRAAYAQTLLDALKADTPAYAVDNGYLSQHFAGASSAREAEELIEAYRQQLADMIVFMMSPSEAHTFSVSVDPASPSTVASGGTTSLSASAADSYSYHTVTWSWNDGGAGGGFSPSSTAQNPTYTAPANTGDADLSVTLSVTGTCSGTSPLSDTKTTTLTVQPVAHTFSVSVDPASPSTVASGGTTSLSASAADSYSYHTVTWSWNDGGAGGGFSPSSTTQNPTYTAPANTGDADLSVTLSVTGTCSATSPLSDTKTTTLTVQLVAHTFSVSVDPPSPATVASGGSTDLSASATDSRTGHTVTWSWNDGGAGGGFSPSSTAQNPTYAAPTNTGDTDLTVTFSVTGTCSGGGSDTKTTSLTVQPAAHTFSVSVDPPSPGTVASGGTTSLAASATDSRTGHTVTWSWTDGGAGGGFSPSSTAQNPTYTAPANAGDSALSVTLSVTGTCSGGESDTKTTSLTVQPVAHTFSVSVSPASPATVASGGSTGLSASAADSHPGHTVTWSWSDGGAGGAFSPSASVQNPSYTAPTNLGASPLTVTFTVSATCNGPSPATDSGSTALTVQPYVGTAEAPASGFPSTLLWDAAGAGSITFHNTGAFAWDPAVGYHLLASEGINRWGQAELPLGAPVAAGASTTFALSLTAPPVTTLRYDGSATPTAPVEAGLDCAWDLAKGDHLLTGGSASGPVVISRFPDEQPGTDGAWARAQIEACAGRVPQIVGGYPDGSYGPRITVTRDQMAVFIQRALDLPLEAFVGHFPDVTAGDAWCNQQIEAMWRAGLVGGYPDGTYRPTEAVNRLQMAAYIARGMLRSTTLPPGPPTPSFPDVAPDGWGGYDAVEYLKAQTIVAGYPDGHYHPEIAVTRDQMAVFVCRGFIDRTSAAVILGGPAVTAQDPATGGECGWASAATAPLSAPGYAYVAFDAYRLAESMAADGDWRVRLELRAVSTPSTPATGDYTFTRALSAADIHAARAAAFATGYPHWTVAWPIPTTLSPGGYQLVVSVEDAHGDMREVARKPLFALTP